VIYEISEDNEAYCFPTFLILALALAVGILVTGQYLMRQTKPVVALICTAAFAPILAFVMHYSENNHRNYWIAYDYAHNAVANVEPGGLLLTMDWQIYSPLLYLQKLEGLRPDVTVINVNLLRRSWYLDYLGRHYPYLVSAVKPQMQAFRQQLKLFEEDRPYRTEDIQKAFVNLVNAFIVVHRHQHPVYMTVDMTLESEIARQYFQVPKGLLFELFDARPSDPVPAGMIELRGIDDGSIRLDAVMQRVRNAYAVMTLNRGIYLRLYGRNQEAQGWINRATAIDPLVFDQKATSFSRWDVRSEHIQ
jgi:hypothetical protein